MPIYKDSTMIYYANGDRLEIPCDVRIDRDIIVVSYQIDQGHAVYQGLESSPGHFELREPTLKGRGTLHRLPEDMSLCGWWFEGGSNGGWRIDLNDDDEAEELG